MSGSIWRSRCFDASAHDHTRHREQTLLDAGHLVLRQLRQRPVPEAPPVKRAGLVHDDLGVHAQATTSTDGAAPSAIRPGRSCDGPADIGEACMPFGTERLSFGILTPFIPRLFESRAPTRLKGPPTPSQNDRIGRQRGSTPIWLTERQFQGRDDSTLWTCNKRAISLAQQKRLTKAALARSGCCLGKICAGHAFSSQQFFRCG